MSDVGVFSAVGVLKWRGIFPHGTERPRGTHDIPCVHHGVPHGAECPPRCSRCPRCAHGFPNVLSAPHGAQDVSLRH